MIRIVTWKWSKYGYRSKFTGEHVNLLRDMVRRNTTVPHEFVCITDDPSGIDKDIRIIPLWENPAPHYGGRDRPNCFYRLKAFSPEMQTVIGDKFMWLDLDTLIVGNIDAILNDKADFKMWRVDGERMPCNGSMVMMKAGVRPEVWNEFDPKLVERARGLRKRTGFIGSDQAWISQYLKPEDTYFGKKDGVYSFRCHIKDSVSKEPPENAKIVFFHGRYDPWTNEVQNHYPWARKAYEAA